MKNFQQLLSTIEQVHQNLQASAANAVNKALTLRNWLIGFYIVEFEQDGEDRAKYGGRVLIDLAKGLKHIKGLDERALRKFRQFYLTYPQIATSIRGSLSPELNLFPKWGTVSPESKKAGEFNTIVGTPSPQKKLQVPPDKYCWLPKKITHWLNMQLQEWTRICSFKNISFNYLTKTNLEITLKLK